MAKTWVELAVEIHPSLVEAVSSFLIEQGSPGVIQEELPGPAHRKKDRLFSERSGFSGKKAKNSVFPSFRQSTPSGHFLYSSPRHQRGEVGRKLEIQLQALADHSPNGC